MGQSIISSLRCGKNIYFILFLKSRLVEREHVKQGNKRLTIPHPFQRYPSGPIQMRRPPHRLQWSPHAHSLSRLLTWHHVILNKAPKIISSIKHKLKLTDFRNTGRTNEPKVRHQEIQRKRKEILGKPDDRGNAL